VYRFLGKSVFLSSVLLLSLAGCWRAAPTVAPVSPKGVASDTQLVLKLPASVGVPSHAKERVTTLTINGKDASANLGDLAKLEAHAQEITVNVDDADAGKTVKVVYSYWPYAYSNTVRTKEVKLESGKKIAVDFHTEDPAFPDFIKPIYVPTPDAVVEEMCKMGSVGKTDVVFDIGCGDGRLVITSVQKFGAKKGVGIDIDPERIKDCHKNAAAAGVTAKVEFRMEDALKMKDLSDATVVLLYVGEDFGAKLEPVLRRTLKPGARVVSHRFPLGSWRPDDEKTITAKNLTGTESQYVLKLWTIRPGIGLNLRLPASPEPYSNHPERVPKLTVNGKDEPVKWGDAKDLAVTVDAGEAGKTISIVYSFWPYGYSNTIRKREVKLEKDKEIVVDFHKESPTDLIKPIYFPTPVAVVDEMCKMAKVGKNDVVYDIGCGDGRMVIAGVKKFGAKRGVGVDIDAELVKLCNKNAKEAGVADKVEFRNEDALKMKDLSDATVVLLYVGEDFGKVLEPVLRKTLKSGARVVSHRFPLGDWQPDVDKTITAKNNYDDDEEYVLKMWTIK
jgi:cyclopropane fatty-acyl-phospholipid synthase-like methyltransferase